MCNQSKAPIAGVLIRFFPVGGCGYSTAATLSLIKTKSGDTIRVLQMCDTTKTVVLNSKVALHPTIKSKRKASIILSDPQTDCLVEQTYYGRLLKE
jgi:hypothetical protein